MSAITQAFFNALCADTVDTSGSNPSLLTLSNRSPQRQQQGVSLAATTLHPGASAGAASFVVSSAAGLAVGQWLWLGGPTPEVVRIAPGGIAGTTITPAAPLQQTHPDLALASALATIITTEEPRTVVTDPSWYWRIVIGPEHEHPVASPMHRSPLRLYESLIFVKAYDSEPSRLLVDQVRDRLDWLLNLGDAGAQGNPDPLLATAAQATRAYIERCELVESPEPHWDYSSLVRSVPLMLRVDFQKLYALTPSGS